MRIRPPLRGRVSATGLASDFSKRKQAKWAFRSFGSPCVSLHSTSNKSISISPNYFFIIFCPKTRHLTFPSPPSPIINYYHRWRQQSSSYTLHCIASFFFHSSPLYSSLLTLFPLTPSGPSPSLAEYPLAHLFLSLARPFYTSSLSLSYRSALGGRVATLRGVYHYESLQHLLTFDSPARLPIRSHLAVLVSQL